jgi:hypothetical protein
MASTLDQQDSRSSRFLRGYDEPEILRSSSRQFCLTTAEAGHRMVMVLKSVLAVRLHFSDAAQS